MYEEPDLQGQIEEGFQGGEQPSGEPSTEPTSGSEDQKTPPSSSSDKPMITEAQLEAEKRAAAAEARLEALNEAREGAKPPPPDPLQEALDALPDDQKEIAKDLMPLLEKLKPSGDTVSKAEAQQMVQDAININHLESWKDKMANTWNGTDGKPKFDWDKLDAYMQKKGLSDPEVAFRDMEFDALSDYRHKSKANPKPTVDAGGKAVPPQSNKRDPEETEAQAQARHVTSAEKRLAAKGY